MNGNLDREGHRIRSGPAAVLTALRFELPQPALPRASQRAALLLQCKACHIPVALATSSAPLSPLTNHQCLQLCLQTSSSALEYLKDL